ncbi:MAG: septation protein SpoVG family protein [Candidatus Omnitrophica bacterium]|nr:septation protein SpoVG family protein [Candidatus Omnitrophota bacterium]
MADLGLEVVDIRKFTGSGNLKAIADIRFGESLVVKGFSVVKGKRGVFVSMPRKASKDGHWFDMLTPTSDAFKNRIEEKVLEAYDREVDGVEG